MYCKLNANPVSSCVWNGASINAKQNSSCASMVLPADVGDNVITTVTTTEWFSANKHGTGFRSVTVLASWGLLVSAQLVDISLVMTKIVLAVSSNSQNILLFPHTLICLKGILVMNYMGSQQMSLLTVLTIRNLSCQFILALNVFVIVFCSGMWDTPAVVSYPKNTGHKCPRVEDFTFPIQSNPKVWESTLCVIKHNDGLFMA